MGRKYWRPCAPDVQPDKRDTVNFCCWAISDKSRWRACQLAEQQAAAVAKILRARAGPAAGEGPHDVVCVQTHAPITARGGQRGAAAKSLTASRGHWKYNVVDAYACIVPPSGSAVFASAASRSADRGSTHGQPRPRSQLVRRRCRSSHGKPRRFPRTLRSESGRPRPLTQ